MKPTDPEHVASIYDLAHQTGLSTSTVSRVLNQRGRISEKTRLRVLNAARQAGFRPRAAVRQTTIAIVLDRLRYNSYGGYVPTLLGHLAAELAEHRVAAEVYSEGNVDQLGTRFIDGVVALTWDDATVQRLRELERVPVVLVNRNDIEEFSAAVADHFQGGTLVAEHLLAHGHRCIGMLTEEGGWGYNQRVEALRQAMRRAGGNPADVRTAETQHGDPLPGLRRLLDAGATGLFLAGEDLTLPAMAALTRDLQLRVPQDVSVVGLEVQAVSPHLSPALTTLAQPLHETIVAALELVTSLIANEERRPVHRMLDNRLIERDSVRAVD
ncbi:MAG: LacI family DNA-binding transcriptional regulator [Planctomycetota bacterium]